LDHSAKFSRERSLHSKCQCRVHTETVEKARGLADELQVAVRVNTDGRSNRALKTTAILRSAGGETQADVVSIGPTLIVSERPSHASAGLTTRALAHVTLTYDAGALKSSSKARLIERTVAPEIWTECGVQALDRVSRVISSEVSIPGRFEVVAPRTALAARGP
jgi:hypothetical protein